MADGRADRSLEMAAPTARGRTVQGHAQPPPHTSAARTRSTAAKKQPLAAAAAAAGAPAAARGSRQAAFLQLTCSVHEEVEEQQKQLNSLYADLSLRCEDTFGGGANMQRRQKEEAEAAPSMYPSMAPPAPAAAAAAAKTFSIPTRPFRFTTTEEPVRASLSDSMARIYSNIDHIQQQQSTQPQSWRGPEQPPFITAKVTVSVEEGSPLSQQPPQQPQQPPPLSPSARRRPLTPPHSQFRGDESGVASARSNAPSHVDAPVQPVAQTESTPKEERKQASQFAELSREHAPAFNSVAAAPILEPERKEPSHYSPATSIRRADSLSVSAPPPAPSTAAAAAAAAAYPALQRAADLHAAAMQPPLAAAQVDMFPSLSRALLMRQERIKIQAEAATSSRLLSIPSATPALGAAPSTSSAASSISHTLAPSSSAAATPAALSSSRLLSAAASRFTPSAFSLTDATSATETSAVATVDATSPPLVLSPAEQERRGVQYLLKQQALQILCDQAQARIKQMTVRIEECARAASVGVAADATRNPHFLLETGFSVRVPASTFLCDLAMALEDQVCCAQRASHTRSCDLDCTFVLTLFSSVVVAVSCWNVHATAT